MFAESKIVLVVLAYAVAALPHAADDTKAKEQQAVRDIANKTLRQLYEAQPKAKNGDRALSRLRPFNNMGVEILVIGSGKSKGLALNNNHERTFMKMMELQAGLGVGREN